MSRLKVSSRKKNCYHFNKLIYQHSILESNEVPNNETIEDPNNETIKDSGSLLLFFFIEFAVMNENSQ